MEISVTNRQRKTGISTKHVELLACRVLENESACFEEISINFLGSKAVRSLNRRFTGRDEVTDTLAFEIAPEKMRDRPVPAARAGAGTPCVDSRPDDMFDDFRGARLGDVIVCVDRAVEQAERYGVGLNKELARLTIHGLLHLCGLDDRTRTQKLRMRRRENFYMRRLSELVRSLVPAIVVIRGPLRRRAALPPRARRLSRARRGAPAARAALNPPSAVRRSLRSSRKASRKGRA